MNITANLTTTAINNGARTTRTIRYNFNTDRIEWNFVPATNDRPAQARIHHKRWNRQLDRFDTYPALVTHQSLMQALSEHDINI